MIKTCSCSAESVILLLRSKAVNNLKQESVKGLLELTEFWAISKRAALILSAWGSREGNGSLTRGIRHRRDVDKTSSYLEPKQLHSSLTKGSSLDRSSSSPLFNFMFFSRLFSNVSAKPVIMCELSSSLVITRRSTLFLPRLLPSAGFFGKSRSVPLTDRVAPEKYW